MRASPWIGGIGGFLVTISSASAQVTVWVDFTSDIHNGIGGGPNSAADWIDELGKATTSAGVTAFTPAERSTIESTILSQLATIYSGYSITFTTTMPLVGEFDAIAYGKESFGFSALGEAPVDQANIESSHVAGVATGNFDFIIDEFTGVIDRSTQLDQISTALAGTGAHELGHSFGFLHHHSYGDPAINPFTYAATGGVQNTHISATAETGLTEAGREVLRSLGQWEKAILDIAGGATAAYPGLDHQKLVTTPITIDLTEDGPADAGATPPTSTPIALTAGEKSGMKLKLLAGDLDGTPGDMDMYKFSITEPSFLTAEIFSDGRFASPADFDPTLVLTDAGGAPLTVNDDVFHEGDVYGAVTFQQNDSFILNFPLGPGIYHLLVHSSFTPSLPPAPGDAYWLLVGTTPVPEPATCLLLSSVALALRRRARITAAPAPTPR